MPGDLHFSFVDGNDVIDQIAIYTILLTNFVKCVQDRKGATEACCLIKVSSKLSLQHIKC